MNKLSLVNEFVSKPKLTSQRTRSHAKEYLCDAIMMKHLPEFGHYLRGRGGEGFGGGARVETKSKHHGEQRL